jgi:hypothetical protein
MHSPRRLCLAEPARQSEAAVRRTTLGLAEWHLQVCRPNFSLKMHAGVILLLTRPLHHQEKGSRHATRGAAVASTDRTQTLDSAAQTLSHEPPRAWWYADCSSRPDRKQAVFKNGSASRNSRQPKPCRLGLDVGSYLVRL